MASALRAEDVDWVALASRATASPREFALALPLETSEEEHVSSEPSVSPQHPLIAAALEETKENRAASRRLVESLKRRAAGEEEEEDFLAHLTRSLLTSNEVVNSSRYEVLKTIMRDDAVSSRQVAEAATAAFLSPTFRWTEETLSFWGSSGLLSKLHPAVSVQVWEMFTERMEKFAFEKGFQPVSSSMPGLVVALVKLFKSAEYPQEVWLSIEGHLRLALKCCDVKSSLKKPASMALDNLFRSKRVKLAESVEQLSYPVNFVP